MACYDWFAMIEGLVYKEQRQRGVVSNDRNFRI